MDLIFSLFGKRIAKRLAANHYRPKDFTDMTFAFTGDDGHAYYAWQNFGEMPLNRVKGIEAIMLMIDRRMSDQDVNKIADQIQSNVQDGIISSKTKEEKADAAAKVMVLTNELKYRAKDIIPEDLYYDLAAHCVVRDDESPVMMDRQIHVQKLNMLRDAGQRGASFFLSMPMFSDLLGASLTTEAGLMRLLPKWRQRKERQAMVETVISSKKPSQPIGNTSTGSSSGWRPTRPKAFKR